MALTKQEYQKKYQKEYRNIHREKSIKYYREYYHKNKIKWNSYNKEQKKGGKYHQRRLILKKIWRDNNRAKVREYNNNSYHNTKHKLERIVVTWCYIFNNSDKIKKRSRQYYEKNKKKINRRHIEYAKKNPEIHKKSKKKYRATDNGKFKNRMYSSKYRDKFNRTIEISYEEYKKIKNKFKKCVYCNSTENLVIDHIIPLSKGGKTNKDNLVVACKPCNSSKHNKSLKDWCNSKDLNYNLILTKINILKNGINKQRE